MSVHSFSSDPSGKRNSLGMNPTVYQQLLRLLEKRAREPRAELGVPTNQRAYTRVEFLEPYLDITLHGIKHGNRQRIVVATRNISKGGISFLHSNFIYPGTRVSATITKLDGTPHPFNGTVRRCELRGGVIHEVGVQFDQEICIHEFVHTDIFERPLTFERVNPASISGSVLLVANDEGLIEDIGSVITQTHITLSSLTCASAALATELSGYQLVIVGMDAGEMTGSELTRKLRERGYFHPIMLVGDANQSIHREQAGLSEADFFLQTPVVPDRLLRALAEFLSNDWTPERLRALRKYRPDNRAANLRGELRRLGATLRENIERNDTVKAYITLASVRNIATVLGLKGLQAATHDVCDHIADSGSITPFRDQLELILSECA